MSGTANTPAEPGRSRKRVVLRALAALVLAAVGFGGWVVYGVISVSLQAEENLQATVFTIRLVEQFVAEHGGWPRSWGELEGASPRIRRCVEVDFAADPAAVARQDPMTFTAIRPIGPYYEYRDYGFVTSLQRTIRRSVKGADGP